MSAKKQIPLVDGLFTWPSDQPSLIGSRCKTCGEYYFPKVNCKNPDCPKKDVEEVLLSRRGKLWSYTIEPYQPPLPYKGPLPVLFGLVEIPENLKVMGWLTGCKYEDLKFGMKMELVIEKAWEDEEGNDLVFWKFKPV